METFVTSHHCRLLHSNVKMAEAMLHSLDVSLRKETSLNAEEILNMLTEPSETVSNIPFRPKGGSLYIFKPETPLKRNDWKADGHS